jgi:hypothetical protein
VKDIRVAKIINAFKVVINAGSIDGIEEGTRVVLYEMGGEITDPITNESLGDLEVLKGSGVVTSVQERMATVESNMKKDAARTIRRKNPASSTLSSIAAFMQPYEIVEELPIEAKAFENPAIGDYVRITRK